jgi:hypothetical protein
MRNFLELRDTYLSYNIDVGTSFTFLSDHAFDPDISPWQLKVAESDINTLTDIIYNLRTEVVSLKKLVNELLASQKK